MSRGLPAFFKQFWLHFKKNLRKNLKVMIQSGVGFIFNCFLIGEIGEHKLSEHYTTSQAPQLNLYQQKCLIRN